MDERLPECPLIEIPDINGTLIIAEQKTLKEWDVEGNKLKLVKA